jgi:hypothetical protein
MRPGDDLANEQRKTNRLLAMLVLRDVDNGTEKINLLNGAGFKPSEIATLIGTSPNVVRVTISRLKQRSKK